MLELIIILLYSSNDKKFYVFFFLYFFFCFQFVIWVLFTYIEEIICIITHINCSRLFLLDFEVFHSIYFSIVINAIIFLSNGCYSIALFTLLLMILAQIGDWHITTNEHITTAFWHYFYFILFYFGRVINSIQLWFC